MRTNFYENCTLQAYNETIRQLLSRRKRKLIPLLSLSIVTGLLLPQPALASSWLDIVLLALKLSWLIPLPFFILYFIGMNALNHDDLLIDVGRLTARRQECSSKRIIYTIITNARNLESVEETVGSVLYWTDRVRRSYDLPFQHEIWIVTEREAYDSNKVRFEQLTQIGAKVYAIPREYETRRGTQYKGRALQYAVELRRNLGCNTSNDWVYHQDDETMVGEDTILGGLDFALRSDSSAFGAGFILYPQRWENRPPFVEELARSSLHDILYLYSMKSGVVNPSGVHGSHFFCRADIEDEVGWDYGEEVLTEDRLFAIGVGKRKGLMAVLKGFAYEQSPFTVHELLTQRRRWLSGLAQLLRRDDIEIRDRLSVAAGLIFWASASLAAVALAVSLVHPTGGLFPGTGFLAGFVGYAIFDVYSTGYALNEHYILIKPRNTTDRLRLAGNCFYGLVVDALAPWYALFIRARSYETVRKDLT